MQAYSRAVLFSLLISLSSCGLDAPAPQPPDAVSLFPVLETDPVSSRGDAADDPAIWINQQDVSQSRVIGTDKQAGIEVYNLQGERLQFIAAGLTNNIDLRRLPDGHQYSALAAASNRSDNTVSLFVIDQQGELTWLRDSEIATGLTEPYGLCMYDGGDGLQVIVNDTDGSFQQWRLREASRGQSSDPLQFQAELLREFSVPSQPEGCVADDAHKRLFYGVEEAGIYVVSAQPEDPATPTTVMEIEGTILAADVEGMSLYQSGDGGFLIVSSQGNYSYSVFDRLPPFSYRGSFVVEDLPDGSVDGVQETDGLAVSSVALGSNFPRGVLVVQDGDNSLPEEEQNFKFVSWYQVAMSLGL